MTGEKSLAKDFHSLMKNIKSFSNGQAAVTEWTDDLHSKLQVTITPNDGLYRDGEFIFEIEPGSTYPHDPPRVFCKTAIYHPNIDTIDDEEGEICLNLFDIDVWNAELGLQDVVQGILFLLYNPNIDDALCCLFSCDMPMSEFQHNIEISLRGGQVDNYYFPPNPRYAKLHPIVGEGISTSNEELQNMKNLEEPEVSKTKSSEAGDGVEGKEKDDTTVEMYFGIRRILSDDDLWDDEVEEEEEEEDFDDEDQAEERDSEKSSGICKSMDLFDYDAEDLCNVPDPGDEMEDECEDELEDGDEFDPLISWSKMVYGTKSKKMTEGTLSPLTKPDLQDGEELCGQVIKPAAHQYSTELTVLPTDTKIRFLRRPTVTSRFFLALQTRNIRKWLL